MATTETDTASREEMWHRHAAELVGYATVLVGPTEAHDIAVEAFLRVTSSMRVIEQGRVRAYLFRAVTNEAHNHRRARERRWRRDLAAVGPLVVEVADPLIDVRRAVSALSVRQRAVVYLVYWDDLPVSAVAELLGISAGSVQRHLDRARHHLRKALQ